MNADQKTWTIISNAYETEPGERTERQRQLASYGLCDAADIVFGWGEIDKIIEPFNTGNTNWWWPIRGYYSKREGHTRQHDLYRATFAAFMAALSAKDIKEMLDNE